MDHIAAAEEQIVSERLRRKLEEVNVAAQSQLSPIQDHINFTLQVSFILNFSLFSWKKQVTFDEFEFDISMIRDYRSLKIEFT